MIKRKFVFLFLLGTLSVYSSVLSQVDSVYDNSYRDKVHQLFIENKWNEIDVKYYRIPNSGDNQYPYLNIWETLFFHLYKKQFALFFEKIEDYTKELVYAHQDGSFNNKGDYYDTYAHNRFDYETNDALWEAVHKAISKNPTELLEQLALYQLSLEEQDFIALCVYYMVWYFYRAEEQIDQSLTMLATSFLQKYPNTRYNGFVNKFIVPRQTSSQNRILFDVGTEITILTDEFSKHIMPNGSFSVSAFFQRKNTFVGFGMTAIDAKVNKAFFNEIPWTKDSVSNIFNWDINLGYAQRLHRNFTMSPFLGYRFSLISHKYKNELDEELNKSTTVNSQAPTLGCYFDIEFAHNYWRKMGEKPQRNSYSQQFWGLRFGVSYSFNNFGRLAPELKGNMLRISIKVMLSTAFPKKRVPTMQSLNFD